MSVNLDGIDYVVDQPTDNALNLLSYINNLSTTQFVVNAASPIWLIVLGLGYMLTVYQRLVYAAGQAFNIGSCSDQQLLNLAEIAGTELLAGSATTITCHVTAGTDGDCEILKTLTATVSYEGIDVLFHPLYNKTIASGTAEDITLQAEVIGPLYIGEDVVTEFDTVVPNLLTMTSANAAPGEDPETISALRYRLQRGSNSISGIKACIAAIRNLTGVQTANLYFNHSLTVPLVIEDMTIPPRSCGMFVQGYSDFIADTYFTYLNVPCVDGTESQDFITQAGQTIPVTYSIPTQVELYIIVRVRIPETLIVPVNYDLSIKNLLLPASNSLLIGENYTQNYLLTFLADYNSTDISIVGLTISEDGVTYSDTTSLLRNQIGIISTANITVEETV